MLGERSFVVMLGGLHIEMALWRMVGSLLEDSGWTGVITEAEVASAGTADSFLHASHVTKTRHARQVTAMALVKLQHEAYETKPRLDDDDSFEAWKSNMQKTTPMFKF